MTFWDDVNKELKKAVGEGWDAVRDGAKIGKLRLRINSLHGKAKGLFSEIGGRVYEMSGGSVNPLTNGDVARLIGEIKNIEAEIAAIEREIEAIKKKEVTAKQK